MSIDRRRLASGRIAYDVRLRTPDGRAYKRTFRTKREAEAFEAAERTDRVRGTWIDPKAGELTLADHARLWMSQRPELRPRTVELYEGMLRWHILPYLGAVPLGALTPAPVRAWHAQLLRQGRPGPPTVAKCYRLLKTMLTTAVEDDLIAKNPCVIRRAGVERSIERPVATLEQIDLLAGAVDERYRVMVLLAAWTGLRLGELAGLARRHLSTDLGTVQVERQVQELDSGTTVFAVPKTAAGHRTVAIPPHLAGDLGSHLERWSEAGPDGLVFPAPEGGPLARRNFNHRVWGPARKAVGLPGFRFHDLRHTGNTLAASTGASTRELMSRMGHASPRAALIYQHATASRDQDIARALSALAAEKEEGRDRRGQPPGGG